MPTTVQNFGRLINLISGVNGVQPGGQGIWLPPPNRRFHRATLKCQGIGFAGGTGLTWVALTGLGTGAKADVTVTSAGLVATIVQHSGSAGSGFTTGDTGYFVDPNYPASLGYTGNAGGFVGTVTASSGAITAIAITTNGAVSNVQPSVFFGTNQIPMKINSVVMRNITAADSLGIMAANPFSKNFSLQPGEFPIFFTEPWRNVLQRNDVTSWDTFGQPNFEIDLPVNTAITSPAVTGNFEFDYQRNARTNSKGASVPFLNPVKYIYASTSVPAGFYDWTTIPINFPIARIWLIGATPGSITRLTIIQDGNIVLDNFTPEITEMYGEYGFNIPGLANTANTSSTTWDAAYISDPDQRIGKALKVSQSLIVRIYSSVSQNVKAVLEVLPGNYA